MSLRKRGGIWWIDICLPGGERVRRTTETANKALAQELHDRLKAELWRVGHLGQKPRHTWNEAVVRWLKEQSHKATASEDVTKLRWVDQFLGGKPLDAITRVSIDRITDAKLAQGCSNATVNRTLEVLRAILRKCVNEWEWLDRAPQIRMLKEPTRRIRFLTQEEAQRLLAALPPHLADMAAFSLATGLRAANVTGLQWPQVDLARRLAWVRADQAKARKAIPVPLNAEAVVLMRKWLGKRKRLGNSSWLLPRCAVSARSRLRRPTVRQQFADAAGGLGGQPLEDVLEVSIGIVTVKPGRLNQTHDRRSTLSRAQRSRKQPV
jgi:integrase